jgi:hypothetical protein
VILPVQLDSVIVEQRRIVREQRPVNVDKDHSPMIE